MYVRALALLLVLGLSVGCRYRDPSVDLLEGELRWMEDQIFMLEDELGATCAELAACRQSQQNGQPCPAPSSYPAGQPASAEPIPRYRTEPSINLSPPAAERLPTPTQPSIDIPPDNSLVPEPVAPESGYSIIEPSVELPSSDSDDVAPEPSPGSGELQPPGSDYQIVEPSIEIPEDADTSPSIEIPGTGLSPGELPEPTPARPSPLDDSDDPQLPLGVQPQLDIPPTMPPDDPSGAAGEVQLQSYFVEAPPSRKQSEPHVDAHVTHIALKSTMTDVDFDGHSTDPGLLVVIEPKNTDGTYVALAGDLSIVVLDGEQEGEQARVARWDFDAGTARRRLRSSSIGKGIHLVLPWPDTVPQSASLHVFARYTTVEGKRLEADVLVDPAQAADGWKPARRQKPRRRTEWTTIESRSSMDGKTVLLSNPQDLQLRPVPDSGAVQQASFDTSGEPETAPSNGKVVGAALVTEPLPPVNLGRSPASKGDGTPQRPTWKPFR